MRSSVGESAEDALSGTRRLARILLLAIVACGGDDPSMPARTSTEPVKSVQCVNDWTRLADGIEYRMLNCNGRTFDLHMVRVDPHRVDAVVRRGGAETLGFPFAINANFFDDQLRPLGIVRSEGQDLNPPHPVSWQSIFYVTRVDDAGIVVVDDWNRVKGDARVAVQAGPRLIVNGKKNHVVRARPAWRSGVCVDRSRRPIFFVTPPDAQFDVWQMIDLAMAMQCRDAMLFDGGPSTQIHAAGKVEVRGDARVPAFVVMRP
jgi:uncharacterized protein YigE (DUF2233 family)